MTWAPTKLRTWHELLMDFMLLRPDASHEEAAAHFDCHVGTISVVVNTDLFKARLAERRERMSKEVETQAREKLSGKIADMADASLDILNKRLKDERTKLGLGAVPTLEMHAVQETLGTALKALGFGATPPASLPAQHTNVIFVDKDLLASARNRMRGGEAQVIDNEQSKLPATA